MRLPSDANDVVLLTKCFASDQLLIQDDRFLKLECPGTNPTLCCLSFSFIDARSRYWLSQSATSEDCLHFHVLRGALLGWNRPSVSTTFSWPSSCWIRFQQKAWCAACSSWWLAFHQMHSVLQSHIQVCHFLQPRSRFVVTNNLESLHLYRGLKKFLVTIKQCLHWSVRLVCLYWVGRVGVWMHCLGRQSRWHQRAVAIHYGKIGSGDAVCCNPPLTWEKRWTVLWLIVRHACGATSIHAIPFLSCSLGIALQPLLSNFWFNKQSHWTNQSLKLIHWITQSIKFNHPKTPKISK